MALTHYALHGLEDGFKRPSQNGERLNKVRDVLESVLNQESYWTQSLKVMRMDLQENHLQGLEKLEQHQAFIDFIDQVL